MWEFRAQGFGVRVFKAYGSLGCRVSDLGFFLQLMGVWGAGFRVERLKTFRS